MLTTKLESGPVALYGQLAAILRDKIRSGIWPDGYEIPTLEALTEEYSLARVTVRQAVQTLVREGLLSSHRGRRTFVTFTRSASNPLPLYVSVNLIAPHSPDYSVRVTSIDVVSAANIEPVFRGQFSGEYIRLRKTDYESGHPYSTSTHHIRKSVFDRFPPNAATVIKIVRLMRDYAGSEFDHCVERIGVKSATVEEALQLACSPGVALGTTHRIFVCPQNEIIYEGRLSYDGDRFGIERDITSAVRG